MSTENELRLEVAVGRARGFSFVVDERLVIGRDSEGPGRLAGDPEISRHHAEIVLAPSGEFTIRDLSSTNGTFVNGTRLTKPGVLVVGDEIEVGATKLVVLSAPVASAPAPPAVDVRAETVIGGVPQPAGPVQTTPPQPAEEAQVQTEPEPATARAPLTVQLTIDFDEATAQLSVGGRGEPIQLALEHGRWRVDEREL